MFVACLSYRTSLLAVTIVNNYAVTWLITMPWHAPAKIKRGGHFCVLTGMWVFQTITLHRATNPAQSRNKIRLAFHFIERNNSLNGFHSREETYLCYKKITREYRLIRDFNFITRYEVSQSVLLRCTRTDTFVNNRNIFSNLSALVSQTLWVRAGILLGSRSRLKIRWRFWRCFLSRLWYDGSFEITWFSIGSLINVRS